MKKFSSFCLTLTLLAMMTGGGLSLSTSMSAVAGHRHRRQRRSACEPTTTTTSTEAPPQLPLVCPSPEKIWPCTCNVTTLDVRCQGKNVTQQSINDVFEALKAANGRGVRLNNFELWSTDMTELDLTPLLNCYFYKIDITWMNKLAKIYGPPLDDQVMGSIDTKVFHVAYNVLTNEGLAHSLKYLSPKSLQVLSIFSTRIRGGQFNLTDGSGDIEFLPGLSSFTNLFQLNVGDSRMMGFIGGGQFKRNGRLNYLDIQYSSLVTVGENAFLIDRPPDATTYATIFLSSNELTSDAIHPNSGLSSFEGRVYLGLSNNKFEYINQQIFEPFLYANQLNEVAFGWYNNTEPGKNTFVCDQKSKWLKDDRVTLESRLSGVFCSNDPGQTIFTTSLV